MAELETVDGGDEIWRQKVEMEGRENRLVRWIRQMIKRIEQIKTEVLLTVEGLCQTVTLIAHNELHRSRQSSKRGRSAVHNRSQFKRITHHLLGMYMSTHSPASFCIFGIGGLSSFK